MKFSVPTVCLGKQSDRFATYRDDVDLESKFALASQIEGLNGVAVLYPTETDNIDTIRELCSKYDLKISEVLVDVFTKKEFMYGSFSNHSETVRNKAIRITREAMDIARELDSLVNPWPGQDGYDYIFQINYRKAWERFVESLERCAVYDKRVKIAIEYKIKEPRTHCLLGTVGKALHLCNMVNMPNLGITMDTGHCYMAGENPAESAVLLDMNDKLFNVHVNDNYADWDWDLIPGTLLSPFLAEFLFWLKVIAYNGWILIDVFPRREDPVSVFSYAIRKTKGLERRIEEIGISSIKERVDEENILQSLIELENL